jgi:aminobenzoyl-glutamate utilization protein B
MNEHPVWNYIDQNAERFFTLADNVWNTPETCYAEKSSLEFHRNELSYQGFKITENVAGIPTAIMGEAGSGGPVIAILGEFDALAGLSQVADLPEQKALISGGNGHGCGHNMLGSASFLAAVAVRDWLKETGNAGTIRYYGCPAEEGGAGKTFMVRDGVFDDVDIAISWHPHSIPAVMRGSSLANCRIDFSFKGRASHAAGAPHLGRSALDAAELMSVGVNYLREHMPDTARVHHAIIDGGGISPNVVQANALVRYVVRSETTPEMLKLLERVRKVANGAAIMTETEVTDSILAAVSNILPNDPLCDAMQRNLDMVGPPSFEKEDYAYADNFTKTFSVDDIDESYKSVGIVRAEDTSLANFVVPKGVAPQSLGGSTDVGDVSWVVPTVQLWGGNYAIGTPFHSWQMVAQGKSAMAYKGMTHAASVMAATAVDVILDQDLRNNALADLKNKVGLDGYICPLLKGSTPPIKAMGGTL